MAMDSFYRVGIKVDGKTTYLNFETLNEIFEFLKKQENLEHVSIKKQNIFRL